MKQMKIINIVLLTFILNISFANAEITYKIFQNETASSYFDTIKTLRLKIRKEYPYLYIGTNIENEDTSYYSRSNETILVVAFEDDKAVGLVIGLPLKDFKFKKDHLLVSRKLRQNLGEDILKYYYISELLVEENYRNQSVPETLIKTIEEKAKELKNYSIISFMTVEREDSHPLNSVTYFSENDLLRSLSYLPTGLLLPFAWPTLQPNGKVKKDKNYMQLWTKNLS
ncbi:MAG: GNAT family N-acetyltransferase [Sphingobacteriia bacterium]|nr:GNAT family N-acetyltransferase [Sphingobacteriia bacterium]